MGFRDDRVALRERIESLESELAEVRQELDATREKLAKVKKRRRRDEWPYRLWKWLFPSRKGPETVRPGVIVVGVVVGLIGLGAVVAVLATQQHSDPMASPGPLPAMPGCTRWQGTATGNSSNELFFRLCIQGDQVTGLTQWVSHRAGWSRRSLTGTWDADEQRMVLSEQSFAAQQARTGWRFCLVPHMDLTQRSPTRMTGTFRSPECKDQGKIELVRVDDESGVAGPHTSGTAGVPSGEGAAPPLATSGTAAAPTASATAGAVGASKPPAPTRPGLPTPRKDSPSMDRGF